MNPTTIELIGTILFALAVIHTFFVKRFEDMAHKYPEGSIGENLFHFLGEVEAVFGLWAAVFIGFFSAINGFAIYDEDHKVVGGALHYLESLNFTEPAFVFVIMCMAATKPVIFFSKKLILSFSKLIPLNGKMSFYISALILGPILGSFITEPAAMTVTALILLDNFYSKEMSNNFKYATIGVLFVNISVGGTLTHFAAPPVLMVASKYGWGFMHMLTNFGWKACIGLIFNAIAVAFIFKSELKGRASTKDDRPTEMKPPLWVVMTHLIFMGLVVYTAHHMVFFMGLFLFFLGFMTVTNEYQERLKLKEFLLVGFFLVGLVMLGSV
jgi:hypothetical protein